MPHLFISVCFVIQVLNIFYGPTYNLTLHKDMCPPKTALTSVGSVLTDILFWENKVYLSWFISVNELSVTISRISSILCAYFYLLLLVFLCKVLKWWVKSFQTDFYRFCLMLFFYTTVLYVIYIFKQVLLINNITVYNNI